MMHNHNHNHNHNEQQSRVLYELSSMILNILRYPTTPAIHFSPSSSQVDPYRRRSPEITPAGFASMMLGISLALMVCGSVTFFIGFLLLPWVIGLVMVFYFVGLFTSVSILGRAFLCYATSSLSSSPPSSGKDIPAWKLM